MSRKVSQAEKEELLSLRPEDISFDKIVELFGSKMSKKNGKVDIKKSRFETTDILELKKDDYFNDKDITTTVGRFIFNKLIVERDLVKVLGYINEPVTGGSLGKIDDILAKALLRDDITTEVMANYLDRLQWLSMQAHTVICGSFTMGILKPVPEMRKTRDKLIKENKDKLEAGDLMTAVKVEKEALAVAVDKIKNDPGMDLFNSGARGSLGNNYKNISVMKGPIFNPSTGKFDVVESNFMEGIRKEELPIYGNAIVTGAYPKAVGTATSGYFSKQITAALQAVLLDSPGSDCKTTRTIKHQLTPKNKKDLGYRYIVDKGKLVLLDDKTMTSYMNKFIDLRTPMTCAGTKICSKCAGEMYYLLGIKNAGLTASRASSTLLNLNMKKFHDGTAKTIETDKDVMFL